MYKAVFLREPDQKCQEVCFALEQQGERLMKLSE